MTFAKLAAFVIGSVLALPASAQTAAEGDWPWWRGPNHNGIAAEGQDVPVTWSDTENVIWKTPVPGRGHSSPTVVGDRIFLATADERAKIQSVVAFDRKTGKQLWKTDLHKGGFPGKIHPKNSHASSTVACDGERLIISFHNRDAVFVSALDPDGKQLWQQNTGPFNPQKYQYGYGPSPLIYKSLVIVANDCDVGGALVGLDRATGRVKWKRPRPSLLSWSSPVVAKVAGRDQLFISGCELVASYDPTSGRPLWSTRATTQATAGTMVWQGNLVFASGGYPKKGTFCLAGDGSRKILWQNRESCYEQSMLVTGGYLYAVNDSGVAFCWRATDGKAMWRTRLGGKVSASPVLAGGNIYSSNEAGTTFVFKADPKEYQEVGRNELGDSTFATLSICGNRIYLRTASGGREFLYCIGKK